MPEAIDAILERGKNAVEDEDLAAAKQAAEDAAHDLEQQRSEVDRLTTELNELWDAQRASVDASHAATKAAARPPPRAAP